MSDFKYALERHKYKILSGIAGVVIVGIGAGAYYLLNNEEEAPKEQTFEDEGIVKADFIFTANKNGNIDLLATKDNTVKESIKLEGSDFIYAKSQDLETVLAYSNGKFTAISEKEGKIIQEEFVGTSPLKAIEMSFTENFIVAKNAENELIMIEKGTGSQTNLGVKDVGEFIAMKDAVVFASKNTINSYSLETKKIESIDIGDNTEEILVFKEKVLVVNNFGSGKNKTTIMALNPSTLYIDKAEHHDNKEIIPLVIDNDDENIAFMDTSTSDVQITSHFSLDLLNETTQTKKRTSITDKEHQYDSNVVSTKGYMYDVNENGLEVFDLRGENISNTIETKNKDFFMPILK